ncbi:MAG: tetratricopeptide repeat protein, partial [Planctomycetaceae bacterium]
MRNAVTRAPVWTCAVLAALLSAAIAQDKKPSKAKPKPATKFTPVHVHIQKGRYGEALEALDALEKIKADAVQIAVHRSRCYTETGKWAKAAATLRAAIKASGRKAVLHARLAEVQFAQGQYAAAEKTAKKAINLDGNQPLAHLVLADAYTETGRTKEALEEYRWFVRFYNRVQPKNAATLMLVGRGSVQYARWKSVSGIFNFIVNTLCPDALKDDENSWQAHYLSGTMLLEKHNRAAALPDFEKALAVNPNAADVLVALGHAAADRHQTEKATEYAEKALKVVPKHVAALQLKADVLLGLGRIADAEAVVRKALAVNPREQRTLARLAACYLLADGGPAEKELTDLLANVDAIANVSVKTPGRFAKLVIELAKRNPRPGYFLSILGERIEERRKFALAERFYKAATRVMPELAEPKTALGMLYMRIGRTKEAKAILDAAFKADPFHVRVSNMRKVLKLLDGYETIATPHFVIRFDSKADKILGRYMAEYLESIYPELTKQFGFEPPTRTQFEIYHNGGGQTGHEWFAARL